MLPSLRRKLTALLSLAVTVFMVTAMIPVPAFAATISLGSTGTHVGMLYHQAAPASVLGLESDDAKAGVALTKALRSAFANRGLSGGDEMSLVEVRLTMGCNNDEPSCMAEGGKTIGVDNLIYGYLRATDVDKYQLELNILDVNTGVPEQKSFPVTQAELQPDAIDAKAAEIVAAFFPEEKAVEPVPTGTTPTPVEPGVEGEDPVTPPPPRDKKYWFGREKNAPTWKKAGLGVGIALAVAGIVGLAVTAPETAKSRQEPPAPGSIADQVTQAAERSQTDGDNDGETMLGADGLPTPESDPNDVPTGMGIDLCKVATYSPTGNKKEVWNQEVAELCQKGRAYAIVTTASIVSLTVGFVMSVAFASTLLIHKKSPAAAALKRHQVRFGAGPTRGGASIGSSFKF